MRETIRRGLAAVLSAMLIGGCAGRATEWEHTTHTELQRILRTGQANSDAAFDLAEQANDAALFSIFSDAQSDFDRYLERHPAADAEGLRQWMAAVTGIQSATLAERLAAADTLRLKRQTARENLDAALRLSEQLQAVNVAQQMFQERWKTAATQIQQAGEEALARRAQRQAEEAAAKRAARQQLRDELMRGLTAIAAPASQPAGRPQ